MLVDATARLREAAGDCATAAVWALSDEELTGCLQALHTAEQQVVAAKLHLVRQAAVRNLHGGNAERGLAAWLHRWLRLTLPAARRLVDLATAVDRRPRLDAALTAGQTTVEQAAAIATAVDQIPASVGIDVVDQAEESLVGFAADIDAHGLRKLGGHILWHVAPDEADKADRAALDRQNARAQQTRALSLAPVGDGRVRLAGWLDREAAAAVNAALDPLCSPRTAPAGDARSLTQRRADALVEVCQLALRTDQLPEHGGERPHLVVTVPFDTLRDQVGTGMLDTGERLSAEQVRRIACDCAVLPAVLGSGGQVLDLGQTRRLFTGPVRRALVARDGGCAFPSCDRPARWCECHHIRPWALGGPTSVDNGVVLCRSHHRLVHEGDWQVRLAGDSRPEFVPPACVDPGRRPRRNILHRRC